MVMKNDLTSASHYLTATRPSETSRDAYDSPIYGDETTVVEDVPVRLDSWERMRSREPSGAREREEPAIRVSDADAIDALQVGDQVALTDDPASTDPVESGEVVGIERVYGRFDVSHVFLEIDGA